MTVASFDPNAQAVTMTAAAAQHFGQKIAQAGDKIIRLSTKTSGCTGYAYVLDLVDGPQEGDEILTPADAITLAVDGKALALLRGTEIDLVTEGVNQVVKFNNPNVVAECGCGESFSVSE
ncbi:iron-sulfur cluster assembly accessory protein [Dasania sp. GY-MA-18]|uniref:Iron-sulfur cluster assembly accessory protein n=1 Tax=Dasania phycosphaerae TaxID=2950436 RepID=A0A9J6RQH5_9GAMM|nr:MULTISPECIES: iron-sulfur cluster assembly accessory protein [Dasania]MCR8924174.1 iron-sulfur cluster assembly accessory protein [Dasania sp. GY-MA-18]MCZ0866827.1 iron-sulfur cluster assembly accessory protein [Dasania phycosphaerae]MCZ0870332.1 iron-sulfur cluster assembly accessory protein [Dasania phycosphaerae]